MCATSSSGTQPNRLTTPVISRASSRPHHAGRPLARGLALDEPAREKRLWNVPLQVGTVNGKAWYTLLSEASTTITQGGCDGALVVDPASVGYFRIQYDPASFNALAAQAGKLSDTTRVTVPPAAMCCAPAAASDSSSQVQPIWPSIGSLPTSLSSVARTNVTAR